MKNDLENFSSFFLSPSSAKKGRKAVDKEISSINIPNIGRVKFSCFAAFLRMMFLGKSVKEDYLKKAETTVETSLKCLEGIPWDFLDI